MIHAPVLIYAPVLKQVFYDSCSDSESEIDSMSCSNFETRM